MMETFDVEKASMDINLHLASCHQIFDGQFKTLFTSTFDLRAITITATGARGLSRD